MSFDLADVLKNVSNSDTGREQIEYIPRENIESDPNNFYALSDIEALADNIATVGLQQPIRVRALDTGRYITVSGHRRRAAIDLLAAEDPERWAEIPCIVEHGTVSPALQQLALIYANSATRKMTAAELSEQAEQVEKLLYQLKEEGHDFPGRMRDHVAQAVNASKTKLARLKVIRDGLAECWESDWKSGRLRETAAYELAHLPPDWQSEIYAFFGSPNGSIQSLYADDISKYAERFSQIEKLTCKKTKSECTNKDRMRKQAVRMSRWYSCNCTKCCDKCDDLATCKNACPLLADKAKRLKAEQREQKQQEKIAAEEKERPEIEYIRGVYDRIGKARKAKGVTVEDLYKAQGHYYVSSDGDKQEALESGTAKVSSNTTLPFGYSFYAGTAHALCRVADALGCSIDYLLGREVPEQDTGPVQENVSIPDTWHTGTPPEPGTYVGLIRYSADGPLNPERCEWKDGKWFCFGESFEEYGTELVCWAPYPPKQISALNHSCKTGMSKYGHCGAAAYCDQPYDCCANCPEPCNIRCGWLDVEGDAT